MDIANEKSLKDLYTANSEKTSMRTELRVKRFRGGRIFFLNYVTALGEKNILPGGVFLTFIGKLMKETPRMFPNSFQGIIPPLNKPFPIWLVPYVSKALHIPSLFSKGLYEEDVVKIAQNKNYSVHATGVKFSRTVDTKNDSPI